MTTNEQKETFLREECIERVETYAQKLCAYLREGNFDMARTYAILLSCRSEFIRQDCEALQFSSEKA